MRWSLTAAKNLIARCGELRKQGRSEAVLRAEFQSWLRQVFPDPEDEACVNHYSEGAEAHTEIGITGVSTASRFIDNLIRSTVIEYEADLRRTALRVIRLMTPRTLTFLSSVRLRIERKVPAATKQ
jgi:hypothetical protein